MVVTAVSSSVNKTPIYPNQLMIQVDHGIFKPAVHGWGWCYRTDTERYCHYRITLLGFWNIPRYQKIFYPNEIDQYLINGWIEMSDDNYTRGLYVDDE